MQPHGAKAWGSVCGAAWGRRRERRRRERTGAEAGRMLRCAWVRLSTTQVRRRRHVEAWRRHSRGAGSVGGAGRGQRGGGSQRRGSLLSDLCVFVGCSESGSEGPSPSTHPFVQHCDAIGVQQTIPQQTLCLMKCELCCDSQLCCDFSLLECFFQAFCNASLAHSCRVTTRSRSP